MPYIKTVKEFDALFEKGKATAYAWPGGYPIFYITEDGGVLSPKTVTKEKKLIRAAIKGGKGFDDQWMVVGFDINWEDKDLYDDHTNERIESAYAED